MPEMTPVANQVIPPDPQKGLGLMSSILGVQQQRQALQTGQYTQATAQADSQQAQQKNSELQAVGNLTKQAYSSGRYKKSDGSFDNSKFADDVAQVAPTYGQTIANESTMRAGELYKNQQTLFNLDQSHRQMIGDALGSMAADPTMDHSKFIDHVEGLRDQFKDNPQVSRMLTSMTTAMPNTSGPELQQALRNAAIMAKSGTADQTNPNVTTMQGPQGLQPVNMNPQSPGGVGPVSKPLPQGLAPTEKLPYVADRASAGARATGGAGSDFDRSNQISSAVQGSKAALPLTQHIDDLAEQIHSGKFVAAISKAAAAVGMSDATYARQVLEKELGQVKSLATANAGSDARAATILSGYPDATSDTQTIHTAMDLTRGTFRQNLARGELLNSVREKDPSLRGLQHADDEMTGRTDPLMHEFNSLKTAEQQAAFYKRNFSTREAAKEFRDKVAGMRHLNVIGQ